MYDEDVKLSLLPFTSVEMRTYNRRLVVGGCHKYFDDVNIIHSEKLLY